MKKVFIIILFLNLFTLEAIGQTSNFYDYVAFGYSIRSIGNNGITNLPIEYEDSATEACLRIFDAEVALLTAIGRDDIILSGPRAYERGVQNLYTCEYTSRDALGISQVQVRRDVSGICQNPNEIGERPKPFVRQQQPGIIFFPNHCSCRSPYVFDDATQWCVGPEPEKDGGCEAEDTPLSPNPCNIATGNKLRVENDFNNGTLNFTRYYNSIDNILNTDMGMQWRHNFQRKLTPDLVRNRILFESASGTSELFNTDGARWIPDDDSDYQLFRATAGGYRLVLPNGAEEWYLRSGQLIRQTDTNGQETVYEYSEVDASSIDRHEYLTSVTNQYGHTIQLEYEVIPGFEDIRFHRNHRIQKVTDAFGAVYQYTYDDNRNLSSVIYPDTTPNDDSDNPRKTYHYENENFPNHLTGITDENGDRYANFAYNDEGKAILSELGVTTNQVGQEKIELDYQGAN